MIEIVQTLPGIINIGFASTQQVSLQYLFVRFYSVKDRLWLNITILSLHQTLSNPLQYTIIQNLLRLRRKKFLDSLKLIYNRIKEPLEKGRCDVDVCMYTYSVHSVQYTSLQNM